MKVKECMSTDCQYVPMDTTLRQAAKIMRDEDVGFLPVVQNDKMIGTVTDRDIVVRCVADGCDPETEVVRNAMTEKTLYCYDDQTIEDVAENMGEMQVRRLPVVNRQKRLVGVISLGDISQASTKESGEAVRSITQNIAEKRAA